MSRLRIVSLALAMSVVAGGCGKTKTAVPSHETGTGSRRRHDHIGRYDRVGRRHRVPRHDKRASDGNVDNERGLEVTGHDYDDRGRRGGVERAYGRGQQEIARVS